MVQSVTRTLNILETLAMADEDVSLTQLQAQLRLPMPTIHRLLETLVERGYAAQNAISKRYGPGPRLLEVAEYAKGNSRFHLRQLARPFLRQLTRETGETSNLVIPHHDEIVYVEQAASPQRVRMFTEVGHRAPLYCTGAGKAILACLPADQLETYCLTIPLARLTSHTITATEDLTRELDRVRERGFAVDNEEFEAGVRCVAAPVMDASGACVASISISGPSMRLSRARAEKLGPKVRQAAALCSTQLGWTEVQ